MEVVAVTTDQDPGPLIDERREDVIALRPRTVGCHCATASNAKPAIAFSFKSTSSVVSGTFHNQIITKYYPRERIPQETLYALEELLPGK